MYITLNVSSTTVINDDGENSTEPYSYRGTSDTTWNIYNCSLTAKRDNYSVDAPDNVKKGDIVHITYAVYSTGDSFGYDNGNCLEVIGCNKNKEIAESNKISAKAGVFVTDDGEEVKFYVPWNGYFESLDYVDVYSGQVL